MKNTYNIITVTLLLLTIWLTSCGGGGGSSSSHPEYLFTTDGYTLKTSAVSGSTSTELSSVTIPGIPGTYTRSGTLVTITIPNHRLPDGLLVDLVFSPGTGGTATSGQYAVTVVDADNFTINDSSSGTITGGTVLRSPVTNLDATYTQSGTTTLTVTFINHGLTSGDGVKLHFTSGSSGIPGDFVKTISVVDANTFTVTAPSAATTSGNVTVSIGSSYNIFDIAMSPGGKWIYATTNYGCANGTPPYCWGDGLISKFAVDWATGALTFENSVRDISDAQAAPVTLDVSPDGKFLYVQDDNLNDLEMYSIDPITGDVVSELTSASGSDLHGLGVSADGTRIYNGDNVFAVDAALETITNIYSDVGGETNVIAGSNMFVTDLANLSAYSIINPDLPSLITSVATSNQEAREVAATANGTLLITAGWCGLMSFDFDGANITPAAAAGSNEYIDTDVNACNGTFQPAGGTRKMFRDLHINRAGNMLVTAYFTSAPGVALGGEPPSGYMLINLAADGSLSLAADYPNYNFSRVSRFFSKP
jgi:Lactonase, 7-bladed beta-propeller